MFLLQPLTFSESLTEGELLLPRYIRTISLHLISWIALAPHQLMDQSPPGMMQTLTMTFLQAEIGLSCSKFSFLHYNSTISLRLILRSAFTLHPYYIIVIAFDLVNSSLHSISWWIRQYRGFCCWQFYIFTFLLLQVGSAYSTIQALHYYISTTSLRLILWIVFALHPYFCTDSSAVQDHFREIDSHELRGQIRKLQATSNMSLTPGYMARG